MIKRLCLILCLVCGGMSAEDNLAKASDSEIGKWREFVGVSAGAGLYDVGLGYIFWFNSRLGGVNPTRAFGGNIAFAIGKQKYTSEKIGWRYLFGLRADYMDGWQYYDNENFHLKSGWGINASFAIDGMFDFVKQNNSRFGMILGIGFELFDLKIIKTNSKNAWGVNIPLGGNLRIGFKGQFQHNVVDLVFGIPYAGGISISGGIGYRTLISTTLTLGYKYLF